MQLKFPNQKLALAHLRYFIIYFQDQRENKDVPQSPHAEEELEQGLINLKEALFEILRSDEYSIEFNGSDIVFRNP